MGRKVALLLAVATGTITLASCDEALKIGPGSIVAVVLAPDSIELAVGNSFQLRAAPVDSTGAFLQGLEITWMSSDPGVASVNEDGAVVGIAPGTATITASVDGIDVTSIARVDLAPSIGFSGDTVRFVAQAGGADPPVDSVTVINGGGFTLAGISVTGITFADSTTGWLTATLDSTTAPATLRLTAVSTGITVAGTYSATVELDAFEASNSPRGLPVRLLLGAGSPAVLAVGAGDNQVGAAGGALATLPSVVINDQFGNPVPGITVTFSVTSGGGSITGATQVTDAQGVATVGSWTLGTGLGANTLQAVITGLSPITFTATASAAPASIIAVNAGDGQTAVAGSPVPTAPQVQVTDAFGNPVGGVAVAFTVTGGGGSTVGPNQTTDAGGLATLGTWTLGTVAGANALRATATGVPDTAAFTATGVAGPAAQIAVAAGDAQTDTVAATLGTAPATLVTDVNGNPVAGVQVTFAVGAGGGGITGGVQTTDATGTATVGSWTLGTTAGPQSLTATATGVGITGNPVTINATATVGAPFVLAVGAGDNQSATAGTAVGIPPEALATDQFGNPIAGIDVTFAVTSGGGAVTGPAQTTDATGTARVTSWTLGSSVGANTLQATTSQGLTGEPVVFTATGISGAATTMTLVSGDAQTDTIGAPLPTPYVVRITDTNGNGVAGIPVAWNVTAGGGSVPATSTTDASGFASATHTLGDVLGPQTLDAAVGGLAGSPVSFSSTATVGLPATVTMVQGNNQTAVVNTAVTLAPEVLVVDRVGNPLTGVSVTFTPTAGGGSTVGGAATTGGTGQAAVTSWTLGTGAGASNNALQALVTGAGIANNPLTFLASATPGAVDLAVSTIGAGAGAITASTGSSSSTITVTVTDQFGNARVGETVTLSSTGSANTFSPNASGTTDAAGQLIRSFSSTQALAKTISATVTGPGALASTAAVTVNPAPVSLSVSTMNATEPITASSGTSLSTVTITVRDQFSNPRSGHGVTIAVSGSSNSINQPGSTTNGSGQTSGTWSSTFAQTKTVSATVTGVGQITLVDNVIVNPAAASQVVMVTNPGGTITSNVNFATQPSVRVRDQFGNNVLQSGISITASRIFGNGALQGTTVRTTNTSGIASWTNLQIDGGGNRDLGTGTHRLRFTASFDIVESVNFTVRVSYVYNLRDNFLNGCVGCHTWNAANMNWSTIAPSVTVSGSSCTNVRLIQAFSTSNSIIWRKITTTPPCGSRMPFGCSGATCISTTRQNLLAAWINEGAANN